MSIVRINEMRTPESESMKYICNWLGLNIRPGKPTFNEETKRWVVPLKALMPSRVTRRDMSKTFVYNFVVGKLVLDRNLRIVEKIGAQDLEDSILSQWNDLNEIIQKEILTYAKESWGKLTFVRTFLRPIYTLVVGFLDRGKIDGSEVGEESQKWLDLLCKAGFIEEHSEDTMFKITNKLTLLNETCFKTGQARSSFDIADIVAGNLFATEYRTIKDQFNIHAPSVYVDTAKLYYIDAVNLKEMVPVGEEELFMKYRQMGNRVAFKEITRRGYSFATALSELIAVGLLRRQETDILGDEKLFEHLVQFRDQISPSSEIVSEA
jgi:hypothetical protein